MISRAWAMPNSNTFSVPPIKDFVSKYLTGVSVDPFSRNCNMATHTNDLNPECNSQEHMDAVIYLNALADKGIKADCILFDPPYSPRQITECYSAAGLTATMKDTQNARLYADCRKAIKRLCKQGTIVLSFGWNSTGMGKNFDTEEILLVCHGSAHNDTICIADKLNITQGDLF